MDFNYKIDQSLETPIYKQLFNAISFSVKKGELADGSRLPTVKELSEELNIARGTVKKTYDELEKSGLIEKVQGRGTFVSYRAENDLSRKERAMAAIDVMLDSLESLGFSVPEINIYLNLKLKERADKNDSVKIALFECNPENLSHIAEQLRAIKNIELYSYLLESVRKEPYKIKENIDIAVSTNKHADEVASLLPNNVRVVRAALRLMPECLSVIVKLRAGQKIGICCYSELFGNQLCDTGTLYTEGAEFKKPFVFSKENDLKKYLKDLNVVLLPEHYEKYCSARDLQALKGFKGQQIVCAYEFDEGSMLYLSEKSKRILESRTL